MSLYWTNEIDLSAVPSPGLLIDADRVESNIRSMVATVDGDVARLRPHLKTHKMSRVVALQREAGIDRFKAATIAEAEMAAVAGGSDVLVAYQMVGPNVERLANLVKRFPQTRFASIVDHPDAVTMLDRRFAESGNPIDVMIDVDCGMHRTGIEFGPALDRLRSHIESCKGVRLAGLHVYDGHLNDPSPENRKSKVEAIIASIQQYEAIHPSPEIVVGGSPNFALWAQHSHWQCSPGTPVLWDAGYGTRYPELAFQIAIALLTRVISKPGQDRICLDIGYKSVASEIPLDQRVRLPSIPDAELIGQSEEHLVVQTQQADSISLGQPLLAYPRHVCPTVALHEFATIVRQGRVTDERWQVDARAR